MNLCLAPVYVRTYVHRGPIVESGLDVATRGQEKEREERRGEREREREERRQGRCLDNSCKVQLARMPTTSGEEDEGMQGEKGRPKGSMWRGNEKEKEKGGKEREKGEEARGKEDKRPRAGERKRVCE